MSRTPPPESTTIGQVMDEFRSQGVSAPLPWTTLEVARAQAGELVAQLGPHRQEILKNPHRDAEVVNGSQRLGYLPYGLEEAHGAERGRAGCALGFSAAGTPRAGELWPGRPHGGSPAAPLRIEHRPIRPYRVERPLRRPGCDSDARRDETRPRPDADQARLAGKVPIAKSDCSYYCPHAVTAERCIEVLRESDERLRARPEEQMLWDWECTYWEAEPGNPNGGGTVILGVA